MFIFKFIQYTGKYKFFFLSLFVLSLQNSLFIYILINQLTVIVPIWETNIKLNFIQILTILQIYLKLVYKKINIYNYYLQYKNNLNM